MEKFDNESNGNDKREEVIKFFQRSKRYSVHNGNITRHCQVLTKNVNIHSDLMDLINSGTKLIKVTLEFPEYEEGPIKMNNSQQYDLNTWYRAYDSHGKTLLNLAFNYDVLSLQMLTFGVENVDVELIDQPAGCLQEVSEDEMVEILAEVTSHDFDTRENEYIGIGEDPYSCHMIINNTNGYGYFQFECCWITGEGYEEGRIRCEILKPGKWLNMLFLLITTMKLLAVLFGPVILQSLFHSDSIVKTDYEVTLHETLHVDKADLFEDINNMQEYAKMQHLKKFNKLISAKGNTKISQIMFNKLQLYVDHRKLMPENSVPVGLFHYMYHNFCLCKVRKWETFISCCKASVYGEWTPRFLWIGLKKNQSISNKRCITWGQLIGLSRGFLFLFTLLIPYGIRLAVYYKYESNEITKRFDVLNSLGLKHIFQFNLLHYLTPTHGALVFIYVIYTVLLALLVSLEYVYPNMFFDVVLDAVQDMRSVSRLDCLRMIASHIILPLEKFGLCGILVGVIYWPIVLPICIFILTFI